MKLRRTDDRKVASGCVSRQHSLYLDAVPVFYNNHSFETFSTGISHKPDTEQGQSENNNCVNIFWVESKQLIAENFCAVACGCCR